MAVGSVGAGLAAAGVLTATGAAFAHVTVHADNAAKGATDGVLTFRVPNEESGADTTKVQVVVPTDHPVLSMLVTPEAGWTAQVTTTKLKTPVKTDDGTISEAVSEITWTGGTIKPGQYQDFHVAYGQLPDNADQLTFKTLQTYSDGEVARWIEESHPGQDEPANPAPVLNLTQPSPQLSKSGTQPSASTAPKASASSSDSTARGLGIAGLAVGVLGVAAAAFAVRSARSARG
ncbi:YcnI family copper-binding membrane protein [Streptomyces sp. BR1]|uniref:YcnI family copper-binding membrane protein n=1 Tax=Streptomyces sp. BR1 TaxID=1592323 RepID=UPI00402BA9DD